MKETNRIKGVNRHTSPGLTFLETFMIPGNQESNTPSHLTSHLRHLLDTRNPSLTEFSWQDTTQVYEWLL